MHENRGIFEFEIDRRTGHAKELKSWNCTHPWGRIRGIGPKDSRFQLTRQASRGNHAACAAKHFIREMSDMFPARVSSVRSIFQA